MSLLSVETVACLARVERSIQELQLLSNFILCKMNSSWGRRASVMPACSRNPLYGF